MRATLAATVFLALSAVTAAAGEYSPPGWGEDVYLGIPAIRYLPEDVDSTKPTPSIIIFDPRVKSPDEIVQNFRVWDRANQLGAEVNHVGGASRDSTVVTKLHYLIEWLIHASIDGGHIIGEQTIVVAFAQAAEPALRNTCKNGDLIGALVMVDYEPDFEVDCPGPVAASIYSIHDEDEAGSHANLINQLKDAGIAAGSLSIKPGTGYEPSFNARLYQQTGVTVEDVVMSVAGEVMP